MATKQHEQTTLTSAGDTTPGGDGMSADGTSTVAGTPAVDDAATGHGGGKRFSLREFAVLLATGLACGVLSGLFGIGGGTIIVPALVWLGLSQRHAAATSLAAIVPTSISGVVSYATEGNVNWLAAALLAVGVIGGSQLGSLLLSKLPEIALRWIWVAFLVFVIVQQIVYTPLRDGHLVLHVWSGALLVLLGVVVGSLAGVLGIGGGAIMMPALSFGFGASDLMARGTSLLVMFPGAISGTVANWKRGIVHLRSGLIVGCGAVVTAPLGTMIAGLISPRAGSLLFAAWLTLLAVRGIWTALTLQRGSRGA